MSACSHLSRKTLAESKFLLALISARSLTPFAFTRARRVREQKSLLSAQTKTLTLLLTKSHSSIHIVAWNSRLKYLLPPWRQKMTCHAQDQRSVNGHEISAWSKHNFFCAEFYAGVKKTPYV